MRILSRHDVEAALSMTDAIQAVELGFRRLAQGQVTMPQRAVTAVTPHNGLHLSMPAFVAAGDSDKSDSGILTIKIVSVYAENPMRHQLPAIQGVLILHDAATGQPLALMDAEYLTALRTGAGGGVAAGILARPNAETVTLFGAGAQAAPQLAAVCAVRPIRRAYLLTRTGSKDAEFCAHIRKTLDIEIIPTRDVRAAVEAADIICTATNATTPIFDGRWLQPGVHINAVGAYTRSMRELDAITIQRSRVYVDHHPAAQSEAGDILLAIEEGLISYDHVVGDLGSLLIGKVPARTNDEEITLFKSVGLAVQDAVTAARVYTRALELGLGQEVNL